MHSVAFVAQNKELKGTVEWVFWVSVFSINKHLIGPWWTAWKYCQIFMKIGRGYSNESLNCPRVVPRKGMTGQPAESQNFPRIIPWKGMPFHGIIEVKSAGSSDFLLIILDKISRISTDYPAESFSVRRKVKISLFKIRTPLLKLIYDKNSTMGSVLPDICKNFF
jgi:hypothetical protein